MGGKQTQLEREAMRRKKKEKNKLDAMRGRKKKRD